MMPPLFGRILSEETEKELAEKKKKNLTLAKDRASKCYLTAAETLAVNDGELLTLPCVPLRAGYFLIMKESYCLTL